MPYEKAENWIRDKKQQKVNESTVGINATDANNHTLLYYIKDNPEGINAKIIPILELGGATVDGASKVVGTSENCRVGRRATMHYAKQTTKSKLHGNAYQTMQQRLHGVGSCGASECRSNSRVAVRTTHNVGAPTCVAQQLENAVMSALSG